MKYFLPPLILFLLVSLSGCFTKRYCERKYPPVIRIDTIVKFTSHDSVVFRDTTIIVQLPGETFIDSIFVPCPPSLPGVDPDTLFLNASFASAKAWLKGNYLSGILRQEGNIEIRLDSALKESFRWEKLYRDILKTEVHEKKYIPIIYKVSLWAWLGAIILILFLYLVSKLTRK